MVGSENAQSEGESGRTKLQVVLLTLALSVLIVVGWPQLASGADETATVRYEFVDSVTGDPVEVTSVVYRSNGHTAWSSRAPTSTLPVGQHDLIALAAFRGTDQVATWAQFGTLQEVEVVPGNDTIVRFEIDPPAKVRFRVEDERGDEPMRVRAQSWPMTPDGRVLTEAAGSTEVRGSDGWAEVELHPAPIRSRLTIQGDGGLVTIDVPTVASGAIHTLADPVAVPARLDISGIVLDPTGEPVEGAIVVHARLPLYEDPRAGQLTGPDGRFDFTDLSVLVPDWLIVLPPAHRPELAASGPSGAGIADLRVPSGGLRDVPITLPYGRWSSALDQRQPPTAERPVTVTTFAAGHDRGANVLLSDYQDRDGWTSLGRGIQVRQAHEYPALIDVHDSIVPDGHIVSIGIDGGPPLACTLEFECGAWRSRGPAGQQIVVPFQGNDPFTVQLYSAPGKPSLYLDPPLHAASTTQSPPTVDIRTADGCNAALTTTVGKLEHPGGLRPFQQPGDPWESVPTNAPGTMTLDHVMVPYGNGYVLVAGDGGVFAFSNLPFLGSLGDTTLDSPIIAIDAI